MTRVACRELAPVVGDLPSNLQRIAGAVDEAMAGGVDVLVLPELATSGYVLASVEEARSCALASTALTPLAERIVGDAVVVMGFAEAGDDGHLYNSAAVLGSAGVLAVHRKAHLWDSEHVLFRPGDRRPPVVDTAHGRIAVVVCYDLEQPEVTRQVALAGADLVVAPVNWPLVRRPAGERPPEVLIAQAAARVNRMAIACCDRSGDERGQVWTQGSVIVDCDGWLTGLVGGDQAADLDLARSRDKRISAHNDLLGDRRPDLLDLL